MDSINKVAKEAGKTGESKGTAACTDLEKAQQQLAASRQELDDSEAARRQLKLEGDGLQRELAALQAHVLDLRVQLLATWPSVCPPQHGPGSTGQVLIEVVVRCVNLTVRRHAPSRSSFACLPCCLCTVVDKPEPQI